MCVCQVGVHVCDVGGGGGVVCMPAGPGGGDGAHTTNGHPARETHPGGVWTLPHAGHRLIQQNQRSEVTRELLAQHINA